MMHVFLIINTEYQLRHNTKVKFRNIGAIQNDREGETSRFIGPLVWRNIPK